MPDGVVKDVWKLIQYYHDAKLKQITNGTTLNKNTVSSIAEAVKTTVTTTVNSAMIEAVKAAVKEEIHGALEAKEAQQINPAPIWVKNSANGQPTPVYQAAAKPLPSRHDREIIIQARRSPEDLQRRTPQQIVQAVNLATHTNESVAARRLPSGDVTLTFRGKAKPRLEKTEWIQHAFGPEAYLKRRIYTVVAKGIRKEHLHDYEALKKELLEINRVEIIHVKAMRTRREDATRMNLIIGLPSPSEANKVCKEGLIVESEVYRAEPYDKNVQPRQCYNCFKFGHIARFCTATARCGHCAATAHKEGDSGCHAKLGKIPCKCILCGGDHTAWSRDCKEQRNIGIEQERPTSGDHRVSTQGKRELRQRPLKLAKKDGRQSQAAIKRPGTESDDLLARRIRQ